MDRITAKAPPKDANGKTLPGFWPTRGNEANPSLRWLGVLGPKGNGLDVRDLSKAEVAHRKEWWEHVRKMRKTPGWEQVYISSTCSQIGPRNTRLLDSSLIIDRKMVENGYKCDDCIGWMGSDGPHYKGVPVSYRALLPKKTENLIAAGRCLGAPDSGDIFRLIAPCFVTGEAAGTAAALAALSGKSPRQIEYGVLRKALEEKNVFIS